MKKIYALAAAAALPLLATARPASPELMRHVNPDGSVVEFRMFGDEHFHYTTDANATTILSQDENGYLAPRKVNGQTMLATETNISMLRAAQPDMMSDNARKQHRMAALDYYGRSLYPTIGEAPALVILLEFNGTPFTSADPVDQYTRFCNEKGYSDYQAKGSVKDYFEASSNGKFSPNFKVLGPVKLANESKYYAGEAGCGLPNAQHNARFGVAIKEALEALDEDVDFSEYDVDKDGVIDNIFFFYSGYGQADTGNKDYVWPHQWDYIGYTSDNGSALALPRLFVDGVEMRTYACSNELNGSYQIPEENRPFLDGIGAFCHEYGHVLGLPDFYTTGGTGTSNLGNYSIMDHGSYNDLSTCPPLFSAYEQWVCNWIEFDEAEDGTSYTLNPLTQSDRNAVRIRIRRPAPTVQYYQEYFILENRGHESWDATIPQDGMLIWCVNFDKTVWTLNRVNSYGNRGVYLVNIPGNSTAFAWPDKVGDRDYILPSDNILVSQNTKGTIPATISSITYDPEVSPLVTFDYNKAEALDKAPVLSESASADPATRDIYVSWTKIPEATNYAITAKRRDAAGRIYTINDLDEKRVGDVDRYVLTDINALTWNQTVSVYVRAIASIPAAVTSNTITFIPSQLPDVAAVDEIGMEIPAIFGGNGCITAPENAKIYNLSGVETGRENLPAGIYIVTTPGATAKVVVR